MGMLRLLRRLRRRLRREMEYPLVFRSETPRPSDEIGLPADPDGGVVTRAEFGEPEVEEPPQLSRRARG